MTNWLHRIPVTEFFPEDGDTASQKDISVAAGQIHDSLIEHRAFCRYVELSSDAIEELTDIADDFRRETVQKYSSGVIRELKYPDAQEFDEAMERLYDWADKNRIWID